jgi:hypothetical protein
MTADQFAKKLAAVRDELPPLKAKRNTVARLPQSAAEIREHWRAWIERTAQARVRKVAYELSQGPEGRPFDGDVGALLCLLHGDRLIEMLKPALASLPAGISAADRRQQLAELDAAILEVEHREQDLLDLAEAQGLPFEYRADANPAVVLRVRTE